MAVKKSGLGRGLDALFPDKKAQNKVKTVQENQEKVKSEEKVVNQTAIEAETTIQEDKNGIDTVSDIVSHGTDASLSNIQNTEESVKNIDSIKSQSEIKISKSKNSDLLNKERKEPKNSEVLVKLSSVEPNREQPRKQFNEDALKELAESIKQYGILQPLLVSDKKDYYEIIAGERRWRAAKIAGLKEIPVIIKEFSDQQIVEVSLIENIQREDLNPVEEAKAYKRLMEEFHLKQEEIADKVSRSRAAVTNSIRLLKLDERVQQFLINDEISSGHARTLLSLSDGEAQFMVAKRIIEEKLSVREIEKLVKSLLDPPKEKKIKKYSSTAEDAVYENLEERMKRIMGTKVFINRKRNNKGKIEIEYYSKDELERIIDLFESIG